jgi:hypothetical protein
MGESNREMIAATNLALKALITETQDALRGEQEFSVSQVRALSVRLHSMAPIVTRASEVRKSEPDAGRALDAYTELLCELRTTLEQIRVMLLARQSQMHQRQRQLHCISQWASALRQTQ